MHISHLNDAPSANDYLKALEYEESSREFKPVSAGKLLLAEGGLLQVEGELLEIAAEAMIDLAKLAQIPSDYFKDIDPVLRSISFNHRLFQFHGEDETLEVTVSNDNAILRVQRPQFGQFPASQAVQALLESVPEHTVSNDIRVVEYGRGDRRLDLALISPALEAEPHRGDIVCGGVHLTIEENGAVQVGPESFRLVCRNGAMARVCPGGKHRLRRGQGQNSDRKFMTTLREFGRTAWRDWDHVKQGLESLARQKLEHGDIGPIMQGLRRSPFFISAGAARRVEEQLRGLGSDLTFYDLHNAITYVGSHDHNVLPQYRHRLRLGAGQLARGRAGVCQECRRLMIGAAHSLN
ncbi:MAG: hypothetical protein LC104_17835 [Bacteroidales bacterium]|nr:hypothetical protein [Bacteroidales bacterium]